MKDIIYNFFTGGNGYEFIKKYRNFYYQYIACFCQYSVSFCIWRNDSRSALEIQFEGKPVTIACKSPILFNIDKSGSFMSKHISQGSRASLCFIEKGEFNFVARKVFSSSGASYELRENIQEFKGKITVKQMLRNKYA